MNKESDIGKLLDEEIKKASQYFFPPEEQDDVLNEMKLVKAVAEEINSRIKGKHGAFIVFNGLLGLLSELSITPFSANRIFNEIYSELKFEQRKLKPDEERFDGNKMLLFELKLTAVSYFKRQIQSELKNDDLPKKLKLIKKTLAATTTSDEDLFKREALIELRKEIEDEIDLKKEELSHREQLATSNKNASQKKNLEKHEDLNEETAVLFIDYLFGYAGIKCYFTKKAEVIEFLTGYSPKQLTKLPSAFEKQKLQIEDGDEVSEKFLKDMNTVRKYFVKLGLMDVVEKIDKDLGN